MMMLPPVVLSAFVVIFGLLIGSFLNVVIHRPISLTSPPGSFVLRTKSMSSLVASHVAVSVMQ